MPWVNRLTDAVRESVGLEHGVALPVFDAMLEGGHPDLASLAVAAARGTTLFAIPSGTRKRAARAAAAGALTAGTPGSTPSGPSASG